MDDEFNRQRRGGSRISRHRNVSEAMFEGNRGDAVSKIPSGKRFSLVAYTNKARDKFPEDVNSQLRQAGFKLPRSTSRVSNGAKAFAMLGSER